MKKNLEEKLQLLAKEILENKSSLDYEKLRENTLSLYEQLIILAHEEKNKAVKQEETPLEAMDSKTFEQLTRIEDPVPVEINDNKENLAEPLIEKIKDIVAQMPEETQEIDKILEEVIPSKRVSSKELEDFAVHYQQMPTFERKENIDSLPKSGKPKVPENNNSTKLVKDPNRPKSLNDKLNSGLTIGLNDRLAFIKHLFNGNSEEYHRVVSQLITMNSAEETTYFLENMVKPDYNNWNGKEIYADRFMSIVEKSFS
ncbi:MAG: hypothetical protein H0X63_00520 [Flavobacteriales bacterium]|jgi:hypothetical protein|nr:hypothetical protein [Flavobacteriales bacterium]